MKITQRKTSELKPYGANTKSHPADQVARIAASIDQFGFNIPVLVDADDNVIAGHGRLLAAAKLGLETVPVLSAGHLTPDQVKAFRIADNRVAESDWIEDVLAAELSTLINTDIDLSSLGFDSHEIDRLLSSIDTGDDKDPDKIPDPPAVPVTREGDLWRLGDHRLLCADCTSARAADRLMADDTATMVFTDPPYNVNYEGHKKKKREKIKNDHMRPADFMAFLLAAYQNYFAHTAGGGAIYVCHADAAWREFRTGLERAGYAFKQCIIWVKNQFVLGRMDYHFRHEPILYGRKPGKGRHLWFGDRRQQTVWELEDYLVIQPEADGSAILSFSVDGQDVVLRVPAYELVHTGSDVLTSIWRVDKPLASGAHPTMKPVALVERAVKNSSAVGHVVADFFGGSGSTLIACERLGRRCCTMEMDPKYCDVIVERWEELTGQKATRDG